MDRHGLRVLVIEDDARDARLIDGMLASSREMHFRVDRVDRLDTALDWLTRQSADLILLDLALTGSHGLGAFEALYAEVPDTPIVVLSGVQDENLALKAVQAGAQDYLVKSSHADETTARAIEYAIKRFRASRQLRQREEHLRLITEQLPCVFWTTDCHLKFTSFAGAGLPGIGSLPETGSSLSEYFGTDDPDLPVMTAHQEATLGASRTLDMRWGDHVYHVHVEPFRRRDGRIAGAIGVALDVTDQRLIDLELRVTRQVQQGLLPRRSPEVAGFDIAGASYAADAAGGDYFDYFSLRDGSTGIVVCDVAGHGLGPAMMMCNTRAYLRALALHHDEPGRILTLVNRFLYSDIQEERLVALFLAKLNVQQRTLEYSNAGHRGFLIRADSRTQLLEPTGIPLNVIENHEMVSAGPIPLETGDLVLLYTDGVIEAISRDGVQFGIERMLHIVQAARGDSSQEIVDRLLEDVRAYAQHGSDEDDMTAVIIQVEKAGAQAVK